MTSPTPPVEFGVGLSQQFEPDVAARVEALGFGSLWVGGHLAWNAPMLDPLGQLLAYASVTTRIQLGTAILLLPLYHPVPLAKTVTTLDVISGGRAVLGVGVGGENPVEFGACGVALSDRGRRADEAIHVLKGLWTASPFQYAGAFFTVPELTMTPPPVQPGGPPVWVGGRTRAARRRASAIADGWLGIFMSAAQYGAAVDELTELAGLCGRDPAALTTAHYLWVRVDDDQVTAVAGARAYLEGSYRRHFTDDQVHDFCVTGTASDVAGAIDAYIDAGCQRFVLKPACRREELAEQLSRLAAATLSRADGVIT